MILPELARCISMRLEQLGDRWILGTHPKRSAGQSHFAQSRAKDALPHDECGPTSRAALFTVVIRKTHTFVSNTIDVGRAVTHQAVGVATEIANSDVVTPNNEDVRFLR